MQMQHQFSVPVPVNVAWPALIDPERVAPCMPGATLTSAEGDEFAGGDLYVHLAQGDVAARGIGERDPVDLEPREGC